MLQQLNVKEVIKNSDSYKKINEFVNKKTFKSSDAFKYALETFNPDIIIMLKWDEEDEFIGEFTTKVSYKDECINNNISKMKKEDLDKVPIYYYKLKKWTRCFWTYHPRAMARSGRGGVDMWVKALFEYMKYKWVICRNVK